MEKDGKLEKVLIHVFSDEQFENRVGAVRPNPFPLPVNPESYSRSLRIDQNQAKGVGNEGTNTNYAGSQPEELRLEFLFDGTKTIEGYAYPDTEVKDQLKNFLDAVYTMNGEIHRPNFLQVQWGQLMFPCIVSNIDLNYTLFEANGDPLRVKVNATFVAYKSPKQRTAEEKKSSPDLTHIRQVTSGDRLDLMTYRIYKDSKYVLQAGKANNLTTIRQLRPGQELVFPPIDKTQEA